MSSRHCTALYHLMHPTSSRDLGAKINIVPLFNVNNKMEIEEVFSKKFSAKRNYNDFRNVL